MKGITIMPNSITTYRFATAELAEDMRKHYATLCDVSPISFFPFFDASLPFEFSVKSR